MLEPGKKWVMPEHLKWKLYDSDLAIMEEFWSGNISSAKEAVEIFQERKGWEPKIIKFIVKMRLYKMKKYLKKQPFHDHYTVLIDRKEGLAKQIYAWETIRKEAESWPMRATADDKLEWLYQLAEEDE